ncbi:hypothetical protein D3C87_1879130 [compost metagenome]
MIFCQVAVMIILTTVVTYVPTTQGMNTSEGLSAPRIARWAMIDSGMICKPEVCSTRNMICAFDAVSLLGFNS